MNKKILMLAMSAVVLLCGCQKTQAPPEVIQETTAAKSEAETKPETTEAETTAAETAKLSKMDELEFTASLDDLIKAFQEDYVRAAEQAGVTADHNSLEYEPSDEEMIIIPLDDELNLMPTISSNRKMIWYAGYPNDDNSFLQEMQLVLMAADNTLTPEKANDYAAQIWAEGWENRNNMPSAIQKFLPSGLLYTFSINDLKLISFQVIYLLPES